MEKKLIIVIELVLIICLLLALPSPAKADGGPILSDPELWAQLKEGQQTAVVTLKDNNTVNVDLFASILDESGQSHEVVFFVPLGKDPLIESFEYLRILSRLSPPVSLRLFRAFSFLFEGVLSYLTFATLNEILNR